MRSLLKQDVEEELKQKEKISSDYQHSSGGGVMHALSRIKNPMRKDGDEADGGVVDVYVNPLMLEKRKLKSSDD